MAVLQPMAVTLLLLAASSSAFVTPTTSRRHSTSSSLQMAEKSLDLVTSLRTEWISAALVTNQIPRSADTCLQLGTEDGRAVLFVPKSIKQIITSSADKDGKISVGAKRQITQNQERRANSAKVKLVDQYADKLKLKDNSIDIVISLNCARRLKENGRDWKASIREAARVLKPGGRLLWVEETELAGESYTQYVENLCIKKDNEEADDAEDNLVQVFDDVGYDAVNLVLIPHMAGVAIKALDPEVTAKAEAEEEQNRMAELSLTAFERGLKKRKKKKKKKKKAGAADNDDDEE